MTAEPREADDASYDSADNDAEGICVGERTYRTIHRLQWQVSEPARQITPSEVSALSEVHVRRVRPEHSMNARLYQLSLTDV